MRRREFLTFELGSAAMARSLSVAVQQRTRLIGALLSATVVNLRNICPNYYRIRCICYLLESRRYQISSALCLHPAATELRGYSTGLGAACPHSEILGGRNGPWRAAICSRKQVR